MAVCPYAWRQASAGEVRVRSAEKMVMDFISTEIWWKVDGAVGGG